MPLPGPECCENQFGIRAVRNVGPIPDIATAVAALFDLAATVVDTTAPVINFGDLDDGANDYGMFPGDSGLPGDRSGDDDELVVVAKGRIRITEAGLYTFGVHSDDGFALRIRGQEWLSASGGGAIDGADPSTVVCPTGTADADTRATVNLPAGEYPLDFLWFEHSGGAYAELYAARGVYPCDSDTADWQLVGHKARVPPAPQYCIGVSRAGWVVEYSAPGGVQLNSIADAEAELAGAPAVANADRIQYLDPESPGGARGCGVPFPQNTGADDDDFAVRATAALAIPVAGVYHFGFEGDDGGYLQIEGQVWSGIVMTTDPARGMIVGDRIQFDSNTANSRTVGAIFLEPGIYTIRALFWERDGGACFRVFGGQAEGRLGVLAAHDSAGELERDGLPLVCFEPCAPVFLEQPLSQVSPFQAQVQFVAWATGNPSYQWYRSGVPIPGATAPILLLENVQRPEVGVYHVVAENPAGVATSAPARLQVLLTRQGEVLVGEMATDNIEDLLGASGVAPASRSSGSGPPATWVFRGVPLLFGTANATVGRWDATHCQESPSHPMWLIFESPATQRLRVSTEGSDFDTVLAVCSWDDPLARQPVELACDNNGGHDGTSSVLRFDFKRGSLYYIVVDGVGGATGTVRLEIGEPPVLQTWAIDRNTGAFSFEMVGPMWATNALRTTLDIGARWRDWTALRTLPPTNRDWVVSFTNNQARNDRHRGYGARLEP